MAEAKGEFEVKLAPLGEAGAVPGRMALDKQFRGDLKATSRGEMLMAAGSVQGSAGYVAMEQVTGMLAGKSGSFVLQHSGTMTRGMPTLRVTVVPDSGSGELAGLAGEMTLDNTGGRHTYGFEYSFIAE